MLRSASNEMVTLRRERTPSKARQAEPIKHGPPRSQHLTEAQVCASFVQLTGRGQPWGAAAAAQCCGQTQRWPPRRTTRAGRSLQTTNFQVRGHGGAGRGQEDDGTGPAPREERLKDGGRGKQEAPDRL